MSDLVVQNMFGIALDVYYSEHNPVRYAHFAAGSGTWTPAASLTFSPSGATGILISASNTTHILSFYLLDGIPALGDEVVASSGGDWTACDSLTADGDTFQNDGRTFLFVKSMSANVISVNVSAIGICSDGYLHPLTYVMGAGFQGPIGPFQRRRFNDLGGRVKVDYSGSVALAEFGVAAVRMFPSE